MKKRHNNEALCQHDNSYLTEHNALSNGHNTIHVGEGLELVLFVTTHHIVLLDVVQALLFPTQPDDNRLWHYHLSKLHYFFVICSREQKHLAIFW